MVVSRKITSLVFAALGTLALLHFQTSESFDPAVSAAAVDTVDAVDAVEVTSAPAEIQRVASEPAELDFVESEAQPVTPDSGTYAPAPLPLPAIADRLWREDDINDALEDSASDNASEGAQSVAWAAPIPEGYKSVILEFDDLDARRNLNAQLEVYGGQLIHQYHHMPYSTVRVPEHMAGQIADVVGAKLAKDDLELTFTKKAHKKTSNHPHTLPIPPHYYFVESLLFIFTNTNSS